jgi:hypothetical protein
MSFFFLQGGGNVTSDEFDRLAFLKMLEAVLLIFFYLLS